MTDTRLHDSLIESYQRVHLNENFLDRISRFRDEVLARAAEVAGMLPPDLKADPRFRSLVDAASRSMDEEDFRALGRFVADALGGLKEGDEPTPLGALGGVRGILKGLFMIVIQIGGMIFGTSLVIKAGGGTLAWVLAMLGVLMRSASRSSP